MKRALVVILLALTVLLSIYLVNRYWIHRFDPLIARQAAIYRIDPDLVWSIIYEETYFSPWKTGKDGEIGLMQVTPTVGREWATETGMRELERQMASDPQSLLSDPERNIQIGCWYLEKIYGQFRDKPDAETRMIAAYNAGPSRAVEWSKTQRREVCSQARSSSTASIFHRRGPTCFPSCNVTARSRVQDRRALRFSRRHLSNDDYLFGALGCSGFHAGDRKRRRGGRRPAHRRCWQ